MIQLYLQLQIQLLQLQVQVLEQKLAQAVYVQMMASSSANSQNESTYVIPPQNAPSVNIGAPEGVVATPPTGWSLLTPAQKKSICQRLESGVPSQTQGLDPSYTLQDCYAQ